MELISAATFPAAIWRICGTEHCSSGLSTLARQELTGPEVPILQGIEYSTLNGAGQFDFSANGTLIYRAARAGSQLKTVQWMDRTGRLEPLVATPDDYRGISLSRDGKRLAIAIADTGLSDLYVYDVERHQEPVRLTVGANIRLVGKYEKPCLESGWPLSFLLNRQHHMVGSDRGTFATARVDQDLFRLGDFA